MTGRGMAGCGMVLSVVSGRVRAVVADAVPRGVPWAPGTRVRADAAGVWLDGAGTPDASPAHVPFGGFVGLAGGTASCLAALRGPDGTVAARLGATGLVSATPEMLAVFHRVVVASAASEPALLLGESGTGKELLARALHDAGPRRGAPFVAVNLAAVPRELAEAELFGCVRGAFTGAVLGRAGAFEAAGAGTLFLDELAESAPEVQAKLLRAVECGAVRRVGASGETPVRARIVAATQRDPARAVAGGALRADLADRLGALVVRVPPLRARPRDLPWLVAALAGDDASWPDAEALAVLAAHPWPGNVRELRNVLARARWLQGGSRPGPDALREAIASGWRGAPIPVERGTRRRQIALSGLPRSTFYDRLKRGRLPGQEALPAIVSGRAS